MKWLGVVVGGVIAIFSTLAVAQQALTLDDISHIHAMTVDSENPGKLLLAAHEGLFRAAPDGSITRIYARNDDFMGFAANPKEPSVLYASGHPPGGGNLGVMKSEDDGKTWISLSKGANGPVDFHSISVSNADPNVIYGMQGAFLQVSRDGGKTWTLAGDLPDGTISITASAVDADTLYAASQKGIFFSRNAGKTWDYANMVLRPVTMVKTTTDGRLYTFMIGAGLLMAKEPGFNWQKISNNFQDRVLLHLTADPANPNRLYATADTSGVMTSGDGGKTWTTYENYEKAIPKEIAKGQQLFEDNCQACHGEKGIGENPGNPEAKDEYGFLAPALNNDTHGWHHSDRGIVNTVLEGSSRNQRMIAWKEILSNEEVLDILAYIKSLWSFRSLACQGPRHMRCGAQNKP